MKKQILIIFIALLLVGSIVAGGALIKTASSIKVDKTIKTELDKSNINSVKVIEIVCNEANQRCFNLIVNDVTYNMVFSSTLSDTDLMNQIDEKTKYLVQSYATIHKSLEQINSIPNEIKFGERDITIDSN